MNEFDKLKNALIAKGVEVYCCDDDAIIIKIGGLSYNISPESHDPQCWASLSIEVES